MYLINTHAVNIVVINLVISNREIQYDDKPANAGIIKKVVSNVVAYGPTIVRILNLAWMIYTSLNF